MENQITEQQVIEFLRNRAIEIAAQTGEEYVIVTCEIPHPSLGITNRLSKNWKIYTPASSHKEGDSLSEVEAIVVAANPPFSVERKKAEAAKLREQAQIALGAAERLEREASQ